MFGYPDFFECQDSQSTEMGFIRSVKMVPKLLNIKYVGCQIQNGNHVVDPTKVSTACPYNGEGTHVSLKRASDEIKTFWISPTK